MEYGSKTVAECVDRVMAGETIASVARDTGVSKSAISNWCMSAGVVPRKTHRPFADEDIARAERMWAEGATGREIAAALGRSEKTVYSMAYANRERFPSRKCGGMRYTEERVRALESEIERLKSLLRENGIEP